VILNLRNASVAESALRLTLDKLIDEIGCLVTPILRDLALLQLHLLRQHQVPYFVPGAAIIRSLNSQKSTLPVMSS
jgi:hypothetical protein